ncbi:MAG: hypothetical protein NT159_24305 [Proteobacteria bacterium]|nr:hypothetical protein [Pseudomonadota bacterium]
MKINLRVLAIVAGFTIIAAAAVVIARSQERENSSFLVERISPKGAATAEQFPAGLMIQVHPTGLFLALPSCDTKEYQDKFFLHIYPEADYVKSPAKFINMDFDLTQEKGKESLFNGSKICVFEKTFRDLAIREMSVGQFTTPGGRCCEITWSRSFLFDARFQKK